MRSLCLCSAVLTFAMACPLWAQDSGEQLPAEFFKLRQLPGSGLNFALREELEIGALKASALTFEEQAPKEFFRLSPPHGKGSLLQLPENLGIGAVEVFRGSDSRWVLQTGFALSLFALSQEHAQNPLSKRTTGDKDNLFKVGHFGGRTLTTFGAAGALYAIGRITDRPHLQATGHQALEALLLTKMMVAGLKHSVARERPDGSDFKSFPSGHSATPSP